MSTSKKPYMSALPRDHGAVSAIGAVALVALAGLVRQRGSAGRRYESSEWVEFIGPYEKSGGEPSEKTLKIAKKFGAQAMRRAEAWKQKNHPDSEWDLEEDDLAFRAYASATGLGVGLWGGELFYRQGVQRDSSYQLGEELESVLFGKDKSLGKMAQQLELAMNDDTLGGQQ